MVAKLLCPILDSCAPPLLFTAACLLCLHLWIPFIYKVTSMYEALQQVAVSSLLSTCRDAPSS